MMDRLYRNLQRSFFVFLTIFILTSATTDRIFAATGYQRCKSGTTCTVGEYLYDDSYVPITNATCTLTSRNPDGTVFLNAQAMTSAAQNDGWYSYPVDTTGKADGVYRSQVCCTSGSDYMCLDKTYEIGASFQSSSEISTAVWDATASAHNVAGSFGENLQVAAPTTADIWSYSSRSLTSFGTLIADIWNYSTRSLNDFTSLVSAVWSGATRTLTAGTLSNGTQIATQSDIQLGTASATLAINNNSNSNTSTLSTAIGGVQTTANTINTNVNTLNTNLNTLTSTVGSSSTDISTLLAKWGSYSASDIITDVGTVITRLGTNSDTCGSTSLFGYARCAKEKWGINTADDLLLATNNVATTAAAIRSELNYNGKSSTAYSDLQTLLTNLGTVATNLNTVSTNVNTVNSTANTINGKVDTIGTNVGTINTNTAATNTTVGTINSNVNTINTNVNTLLTNLSTLSSGVSGNTSDIATLLAKWGSYSASDIITDVGSVLTRLGTNADTCGATTVFGYSRCAKEKWGLNNADDLLLASNNIATTAAAIRSELNYNGKSSTAYSDLQTLLANLTTVSTNLNTVSTNVSTVNSTANTINGKVDTIGTNVGTINTNTAATNTTVGTINTTANSINGKVDTINTNTAATNGTVGTINSNVNTINTNTAATNTTVGTINTNVNTLNTTANTISSKVDTVGTNVLGVQTTADAINGKADTLIASVSAIASKVNSIYGTVNIINGNVSTINTTANAISGTVDAINSTTAATQTTVNTINTNLNSLTSSVGASSADVSTLLAKWGSYSAGDIITNVNTVISRMGTSSDTCGSTSLFGFSRCAKEKWGVNTADDLLLATNNVATTAAAIRSELNYNGKSSTAYSDLQLLLTNLGTVTSNLSTVSTNVNTVNSTANSINGKVDTINTNTAATNGTVGTINSTTNTLNTNLNSLTTTTNGISTAVGSANTSLASIATNINTLDTKVTDLTIKVDTLTTTVNGVNTNVNTLITKWGVYSVSDVLSSVSTVQGLIGASSNTCANSTVFGKIACIGGGGGGGNGTLDADILAAATDAATQATALRAELNFNGKSTTAYSDLQSLKASMTTVQTLIGTSSDASSATTLFGATKKTQEQITNLNTTSTDLSGLLAKWGNYNATDIYDKVKDLSSKIDAVNTVSNVASILSLSQTNETNMNSLKNTVLQLNAITLTNKTILEQGKNKPVVTQWLEEGSVVFKTLITNPSTTTQIVPLKFYIPKEASAKDIMNIDPTLTAIYDPMQEMTYVTGQYTLKAGETKIVAVELTDIWKISEKQLSTLRTQASDLFEPLRGTQYFAQGATLKADIAAALDEADQQQSDAQTPEARIKAYRSAVIQVNKAKENISNMKMLVAQVNGSGRSNGVWEFIKHLAAWTGVFFIVAAVFSLGAYAVIKYRARKAEVCVDPSMLAAQKPSVLSQYLERFTRRRQQSIALAVVLYILLVGTIAGGFMIYDSQHHLVTRNRAQNVGKNTTPQPQTRTAPTTDDATSANEQVLGSTAKKTFVTISASGKGVKMHDLPDASGAVVRIFHDQTAVEKIGAVNGWIHVLFDDTVGSKIVTKKGWVSQEFIKTE